MILDQDHKPKLGILGIPAQPKFVISIYHVHSNAHKAKIFLDPKILNVL